MNSITLKLFQLLLVVITSGFGLNLSNAFAADDLIAGAKKEGNLVLYLSTNLTDANGMVQLFKQKYPFINVNLFRADNEKLLNRILTESTAGKFNGDTIMISSFEVRVLLQKKLLQKYISPHSQYYPEGFTDKDGFWTSVLHPACHCLQYEFGKARRRAKNFRRCAQSALERRIWHVRQRNALVHRLSEICWRRKGS